MSHNKVAKWSAFICFLLSMGLVLGYIFTRDRPLGEGYKLASDYGGEFTLNGHQGRVSLSDFRGKVVVIYFGFMNCQDACPISMTKMRRAFKRLSKEELKSVQGLFVSIDPKRDTPDDLEAFAKAYHSNVIGLVDKDSIIKSLVHQYGGLADMSVLDGKSVTYDVSHSSRFYMIDKNSKLLTTLSYSTTPAEMSAKIRQMLAKDLPQNTQSGNSGIIADNSQSSVNVNNHGEIKNND